MFRGFSTAAERLGKPKPNAFDQEHTQIAHLPLRHFKDELKNKIP